MNAGTAGADEVIVPPLCGPLDQFDVVHPFRPWDEDLEPETEEIDSDLDGFFPVDFSFYFSLVEGPPRVTLAPLIPSDPAESITSLLLAPKNSLETPGRNQLVHGKGGDNINYSGLLNLVSCEFPSLDLSPPTTPKGNDLTPRPRVAPEKNSLNSLSGVTNLGYFGVHSEKIPEDNTNTGYRYSWSEVSSNLQLPSIAANARSESHIHRPEGARSRLFGKKPPVLRRKPPRCNLRADYSKDGFRSAR